MKTALLIIAILTQPALARVGYTLEQCREKYGKEAAKNDETKVWVFFKNEIYIMANIEGGKVVRNSTLIT
jgi:pyruvate/2-oxoglutarate dehydrogenase complex dihydrolipoamide dehydrogenase (E3) component